MPSKKKKNLVRNFAVVSGTQCEAGGEVPLRVWGAEFGRETEPFSGRVSAWNVMERFSRVLLLSQTLVSRRFSLR